MATVNIGIKIDLATLIESRMLIQASSGAGKSYMLRVLAEGVLPRMPVIILDWEGEFATLREKHDMVLVGHSGEVPCSIKTAAKLARSLIELKVSAVIDMSELKMFQRQEYVRDFLNSLVGLPPKLWPAFKDRAVMVMVDEAHKLAPQKEKSVATQAVVDLQSLGRKRGLCGILATQRLSKLDKDAAAECANILVGRCHTVDAARATDMLGLLQANRHNLTTMPTGMWNGIGPAFQPGVHKFRGAKAKTTHARSGATMLTPPAPSKKIQRVIPDLQAVQDKIDVEVADKTALKKEITKLRGDLTRAQRGQSVKTKEVPVADPKAVARAIAARDKEWRPKLDAANRTVRDFQAMVRKVQAAVGVSGNQPAARKEQAAPGAPPAPASKPGLPVKSPAFSSVTLPSADGGDHTIDKSERKILGALAWYEGVGINHPARPIVAVMAGYKSGGRFNNLMSGLKGKGVIEYVGNGQVSLTDTGRLMAPEFEQPGTLNALHQAWEAKLSNSQWKLVSVILESGESMTPQELAEATDYTVGGRFNNLLSSLRTLGLITRGPIKATALLFPEGLA